MEMGNGEVVEELGNSGDFITVKKAKELRFGLGNWIKGTSIYSDWRIRRAIELERNWWRLTVVKLGGYFGIWGVNFGSYMEGVLPDDKVSILWFLEKLILGIWSVVFELELNRSWNDGIWGEFDANFVWKEWERREFGVREGYLEGKDV
jgi:hypothetical protein